MPTWPVTLPQTLLMDGYGEAAPNVLLRSQMEIGPAKVRRRSSAGIRPVKGYLILTLEELEIFKAFHHDDLEDGALRFTWVEPLDEETEVEMRFAEVPSWSSENGLYKVQMSLEILP